MKRPKNSTNRASLYGQKLDTLFKSILPPNSKKEYTLEQVAEGLRKQGTPVSLSQIGKIRRGEVDDPGISTLQALSDFFGVDFTYWTSPTTNLSPSTIEESRIARIQRQVAQGDYTPEQLQFIETMLRSLPSTDMVSEKDASET